MPILGTIASSKLSAIYFLNQTGNESTYLVGVNARQDSNSDIYLGGYNNDTPSGILFKYDKDGVLLYQKTYTTGTPIYGFGTVLDSANNVYWLSRAQNIQGQGWTGTHVAKLNSSAVSQWQRAYYQGNSNSPQPQNIAIDSSDNLYISGYVSPSTLSGFLIKRNSSGTLLWQNLVTNTNGCILYSGALDSSSNVYTSGEFGANSGLMKFNSSGTLQWQRQLSGSSIFAYKTACTDSSVYVGGWANNGINIGMVAKFDSSNGSTIWARTLQGAQNIYAYQVVLDSSENVYLAASIDPGITIIAKYNSSGTIQWQRSLSSASGITIVNANGISVSGNKIYVTGRTTASGTNRTFLAVLPTDGTKTGTYSVDGDSFTYAASTYTDSSFSFTNGAGSASVSNPGYSDASEVYSISNSSFTSNTTIL